MGIATGIFDIIKKLTAKHMRNSVVRKASSHKDKAKRRTRSEGKILDKDIESEMLNSKRHVPREVKHEAKKAAADTIRDAKQKEEGLKIMKQISERQKGK